MIKKNVVKHPLQAIQTQKFHFWHQNEAINKK